MLDYQINVYKASCELAKAQLEIDKAELEIYKAQAEIECEAYKRTLDQYKARKCPKCGAELVVGARYAMCYNFQHSSIFQYYHEGGQRDCDYALLCG